jgi:hypothetical protein
VSGVASGCPVNSILRAVAVLAVAVVSVGQCGCKSVNEGKLEDTKWSSAYIPDFHGISGRGLAMDMRFSAAGKFQIKLYGMGRSFTFTGDYRLGTGHTVYLENVVPPLDGHSTYTEHITVTDDTMVMMDPDGTKFVFSRISEEMEKARQKPVKVEYTPPGKADGTESNAFSSKKNSKADAGTYKR